MMQKFKIQNSKCKILVWGAIFVLLIVLPNMAAGQGETGFEKICSRGVGLAVCVQQIYLFSLGFGALLALLMLVLAGYKYMTAQGNAQQVESAKEQFADAFIGLIIIFAAFILLNVINPDLVRFRDPSKTLTLPGIVIPSVEAPPEVNNTVNPNGGDLAKVAQRIINNSHIILSTSADIAPWSAKVTIQELSQGKYPTVCSPSRRCTATKNVNVNANMLYGLLGLAEKYNFRLESLTTGVHSSENDAHYTGHAADIVPQPNNDRTMWQRVRAYLNGLHGKAICEDKSNASDVPDCNVNQVTHIHWTY